MMDRISPLLLLSLIPVALSIECYSGIQFLAGSGPGATLRCDGAGSQCYNMSVSSGIVNVAKTGCSLWRCMFARDRCISTTIKGIPMSFCCCTYDRCNVQAGAIGGGGNLPLPSGGDGSGGGNNGFNNNGGGGFNGNGGNSGNGGFNNGGGANFNNNGGGGFTNPGSNGGDQPAEMRRQQWNQQQILDAFNSASDDEAPPKNQGGGLSRFFG